MSDEAKPPSGTASSVLPCSLAEKPPEDILPPRLLAAVIVLALYRGLITSPPRQHLPIHGYCR